MHIQQNIWMYCLTYLLVQKILRCNSFSVHSNICKTHFKYTFNKTYECIAKLICLYKKILTFIHIQYKFCLWSNMVFLTDSIYVGCALILLCKISLLTINILNVFRIDWMELEMELAQIVSFIFILGRWAILLARYQSVTSLKRRQVALDAKCLHAAA